jgi:hypothetical protein
MDTERQALEEKVDELRKTLDRLEEEWQTYSDRVFRMMSCKLADPRFPLTDWELVHLSSPNQRANLRTTLQALQNRLTGKTIAEAEQIEIDGISKETLYGAGVPSLDEALGALRNVISGGDRTVCEIMQLAKDESNVDYEELANFVLDAMKIRGGANT